MKRKKIILSVAVLVLCSMSFQSCIGSFPLTNKVLSWNKKVSNKFVNELVFFAFWVLPVYEVTAAADLLVINSIEFWSGNNPLEAHNKVIRTEHGDYKINVANNGYEIISPDGNSLNFDFDDTTRTWSLVVPGMDKMDFLRFEDENHVQILDSKGEFVDVELTREGVDNYMAQQSAYLLAAR